MVEGKLGEMVERRDLLDDVIAKGADVTVRFIQNVERCKRACTCCTL